ncbi:MAG TPA: energy transducer TonB [Thermoanaerobaculia bacterium]|nr:energy transducer TonB [Thermoanaerobaculia bacterium]
MRSRVLIPILFILSLALPAAAGDEQRDLLDSWRQRMTETDSALAAGDNGRALKLADGVVSEMVERLGPGQGSTRLFSSALTQKARAHAALGENDEAAWYSQVVLGLDPECDTTQLIATKPQGVTSAVSPGQRIAAPKLVKRRKPKFPHGAHYYGVAGDLVVEVIVKSDGSVREPRIVTPLPAATLSYAALESVKGWRFEPARADGQPIDVVYNLTVKYKE